VAGFAERYGPWALVVGSAEGIGAGYADALAARGLHLVLLDRQGAALAAQAARLRTRHPSLHVRELVVDLTDLARLTAAIDEIADLDIGLLVANAAFSVTGQWLDVSLADKLSHVQVNCAAVTVLVDRLSRSMVARGRGGIIVMSSMAGKLGGPRVAAYAATKAFDLVLAESLWSELAPHGVDVLAVLPGSTRTPGFEASLARTPPRQVYVMAPEDVVREALAALGRGPQLVVGRRNRLTDAVLQRLLPRRTAVRLVARSTTFLRSGPPPG
jgi:short-subunit dehydrogenase